MKILGKNYEVRDVFESFMTVPDCIVVSKNKIGTGHGEAKFYVSSKDPMREFYGGKGFDSKCFLLKSDLIGYMNAVKNEYLNPTQAYAGREDLPIISANSMISYFSIYRIRHRLSASGDM